MVYIGSKNRIAKDIAPIIQYCVDQKGIKGYWEPFVGGANMIDKIDCANKIGSDIHPQLISLLEKVRDNAEELPDTITEDEYNRVKNNRGIYKDWYLGLVGFCGSFGAKYFGGFARSKEKPRDKFNEAVRNLKKQAPNLNGIQFMCANFLDFKPENFSKYVIYCDIPYKGTGGYKTGAFPHEDFYRWAKEMAKNNIVLISEYSMPDGFKCIWEKPVKVTLNNSQGAKPTESKLRTERLFICQ